MVNQVRRVTACQHICLSGTPEVSPAAPPPPDGAPPPPRSPAPYSGAAEGPRFSVAPNPVVTSPSAAQVSAGSRMYGLVASDLLWVQDLAAFGQDLGPYSSGRHSRVEEA